jgi:hypothetical protein
MDVAGAGAAGIETQFGRQFIGSPDGGLYSKAWANGAGRAFKVSSLTKPFGIVGLAAGTAFDAQSLQNGDINGGQFGVNLGLGTLGYFVPLYAIGSLNALFINNFYPGGFQGYIAKLEGDFVDPLPPVSIRHRSSGRPAAGNDDGFAECSPIFLLADRIHRPQLRQQLVDQRTQPRPRRAVRE